MIRTTILAALAALVLAGPVHAGPGGNGNGNGNGASNGNGGNSANAGGSGGVGAPSGGHGLETSTAARDPATRGLEKALAVVGTTTAASQATDSITSAIGRMLDRNDDTEAE
ncbi:MAG: hypothetical protein K5872_16690 [Rhizobiaceae bacterium]|nr:hypothetical protein [Rhizobiaceae bacterium]MCV0407861.1 hypothetical protein [Rhizobiaceae bacterium]